MRIEPQQERFHRVYCLELNLHCIKICLIYYRNKKICNLLEPKNYMQCKNQPDNDLFRPGNAANATSGYNPDPSFMRNKISKIWTDITENWAPKPTKHSQSICS